MTGLGSFVTVDRKSPVPLYFQVAQRLQNLIESGELAPGDRLDNEFVLAEQLGLSRPTVRQAMQYLVDKGLLTRRRGVGTTVVNQRVRRTKQLTSLYEDLERAGRKPRTKVLAFDVVAAPAEVAAELAIEPGTEVVSIHRLRYANDEPLAILRNHIRADLGVSAEALTERGLYQLLKEAGRAVRGVDQVIGARKATTAEATLLNESRGAPLLTLNRIAYDSHGQPVECGRDLYRASLYSINMSVTDD